MHDLERDTFASLIFILISQVIGFVVEIMGLGELGLRCYFGLINTRLLLMATGKEERDVVMKHM